MEHKNELEFPATATAARLPGTRQQTTVNTINIHHLNKKKL